MIKVLLIGAGTMGSTHAQAYEQMEGVQVAGVVDIQAERAQSLADEVHARAFASYEEAISALDDVDVVDVCLPTYLHKRYVLQAAQAGKHVICEKPLARHLADAEEMIAVCKQHGVKLFVGHVLRFFPEYAQARTVIEAGDLGEIGVVRTSRGGTFPRAWNNWYADYSLSGGLTLDMIIHDFDYLRWCFGEVDRVYAKSLRGRVYGQIDYALVTLRFQSGVIAHVEGTWAHESFAMSFEIAGKNGVLQFDSARDNPVTAVSRNGVQGRPGVAVPESPLREGTYYRELKHFMDCIATGNEPQITAEDGLEALRISLAALESMETGKPVTLIHKPSALQHQS
ncbi:Gfo/Idh/MocA family protein [Paenibacillus jiagnxiensis]|uniref:Gfo/Idh/MocA family protein n=1 Tax=Paenibacillus jiagnxiensis TaxID=3228926 RepID=UPI0033A2A354